MIDPSQSDVSQLNGCGCCSGLEFRTPAEVANRPGLNAIAYRVGTHPDFFDSMLASLSSPQLPALSGLQTRRGDDFTVGLLDAWATVADVLTFYQERIANESYLRTSVERFSLLQQARLIGYELRPGVAAGTFLAFTLESAAESPQVTLIDAGVKVQSIPGPCEVPQIFETVERIEARVEWNTLLPQMSKRVIPRFGAKHVFLKGTETNLKPGDALLLVGKEREDDTRSERWDFRRVTKVTPFHEDKYTLLEWDEGLGTTSPRRVEPAANPTIYALRQRASLFGHNAPHPATLANDTLTHYGLDGKKDWLFDISDQTIHLDTVYPGILPGSWLVLSTPEHRELYRARTVTESSLALFTLAGKTSQLELDTDVNLGKFDGVNYRSVAVFGQSEMLEIADEPLTVPITGAQIILFEPPRDLKKGQLLVASGHDEATGKPLREVVSVSDISNATLTVTPPLSGRYKRKTFSFNGNVARATHGESVREIVGSGDGTQPFQRFKLRQSPVTYVSAANASGARSTLRVFVDELEWHEVDTLYGHGPTERIFVAQLGDDHTTTIMFGDGETGARLPTGQDNVRAVYRKGIGREGLLKDGQLSLLLTRPLGVKAVANAGDTTGGDDRETIDAARLNAPLTVLTLDRIVSLRDYEDFTRAFAGITKALATWTWDGRKRGVFLTVAGPKGAPVERGSELYTNLLGALGKAGDPFVPVLAESFRTAPFKIVGRFQVEPDYIPEKVKADVDAALLRRFSLESMRFGEPISLSQVIATIQATPGVAMVDVDKLVRLDGKETVHGRLLAAMPEYTADGQAKGAELLVLDPVHLAELTVIS